MIRSTKVYCSTQFSGTPEADGDEMMDARWLSMEELRRENLFPPFEASLDMLGNLLKNYLTTSNSTDTLTVGELDGGPGSGRYPKGSGKNPRVGRKSVKESLSISKKEASKVSHDINNLYHAKYNGKRECTIVTSSHEPDSPSYVYRFKNYGFNNYDIYYKTKLD